MLLHVTPTNPRLPTLKYSRFRTLRASWVKAVGAVAGYIDEALNDALHRIPSKERGGAVADVETHESLGQASQLFPISFVTSRSTLEPEVEDTAQTSTPDVHRGDVECLPSSFPVF